MERQENESATKRYAPWLWLLLGLFCLRVVAQLVALNGAPAFMPSFDAWHSATVPYSALLTSQLLIVAILGVTAWRFTYRDVQPRPFLGRVLLILGSIYFGVMLVRLALGLTMLSAHPWFGKLLPAIFHLVLATYVLIVGLYHARRPLEA